MRVEFKAMSKRAKWILNGTAVLALVNFFAFMTIASYLGGDALNGYVKGAHYFLCAKSRCHEVAEAIWRYSYWHAIAAPAGILLVFAEAAIFVNTGDITTDTGNTTGIDFSDKKWRGLKVMAASLLVAALGALLASLGIGHIALLAVFAGVAGAVVGVAMHIAARWR